MNAPFEIHEKSSKVPSQSLTGDEFYITRSFPIKLTPRSIAALKLSGEEIRDAQKAGDVIDAEHEIVIECDVDYAPTSTKGSKLNPADAEEFAISDWHVIALDDIVLGDNDEKRLREYLGDLTEDEQCEIKEAEMKW